MDFSKIHIKKVDEIEDKAFRRASNVKINKRDFSSIKPASYRDLIVEREKAIAKISTFTNITTSELTNIIKSFPIYEELSPFYQELMRTSIYIKKYKAALKNIAWANKKIRELSRDYIKKIKKQQQKDKLTLLLKEFYGRAASFLKEIKGEVEYLLDVKDVLKRFPNIEEDKAIFVVAGAPNVGKSSLINALCGGNIKTEAYSFTTKELNIGKLEDVVILVDTPGILEKKYEDMNEIERKAFVAITKLNAVLLYVFDVSLSSGYDFEKQREVERSIGKHFKGDKVYVLNKVDIKDEEEYGKMKDYVEGEKYFEVSAETGKGIEELKECVVREAVKELSKKVKGYRKI